MLSLVVGPIHHVGVCSASSCTRPTRNRFIFTYNQTLLPSLVFSLLFLTWTTTTQWKSWKCGCWNLLSKMDYTQTGFRRGLGRNATWHTIRMGQECTKLHLNPCVTLCLLALKHLSVIWCLLALKQQCVAWCLLALKQQTVLLWRCYGIFKGLLGVDLK